MQRDAHTFLRATMCAAACCVALTASREAAAQRVHAVSGPLATFESPFVQIGRVLELADGALLVLDPLDALVHRVDPQLRGSRQVGRTGAGPGEYAEPTHLLSLPNGRALIVHTSGSRGTVVDRSGTTTSEWQPVGGRDRCPLARPLLGVEFIDAQNRAYAEAPPIAVGAGGAREVAERAAIERWTSPCERDTVAFVESLWAVRFRGGMVIGQSVVGPPGKLSPPFLSAAQWVAFADGRLAIVSPDPYAVTFVSPDRRLTTHALPHERVAVSEAHKDAWRTWSQRLQRVVEARPGAGGQRRVARGPAPIEPAEWPRFLPPFLPDALHGHADGSVWVERTGVAGAPRRYDVIDRTGALAHRVTLRAHSRLVGLGARHLYVVRTDEDEVEHLERFAIPFMAQPSR